ncbi:barstar family protein [Nocardia africana]|uniref:Barstar (Barnase inhibitor) n=1 Tax=Nocardia africana TaxID=134964 RepID=A0A378WKZ5_9NOCA|nr:barstar family protein [Nocardia africana]MCC3315716.1 barstar family protein [Nocardia africana]SUA41970.1 Barstar (barnase inhibitor) [Nocardia africana]
MAETMSLSQFLAPPASGSDAIAARHNAHRAATGPVLGALDVGAGPFSGVRFQVPDGYIAREVRGTKMRTTAGVFDEFAAALQFPYYFGDNRDAFDECLRDLDEFVGEAPGYVVVIRDSSELLADQREDLEWFADAMTRAAEYWAVHGTVFRVVLQQHPAVLSPVELTMADPA